MAYFRHVVGGLTPVGTRWSTTLHSQSSATITTVHTAWSTFMTSFIGTTLAPMWNTHTTANLVTTYQLDAVTGKATTLASGTLAIPGTGTGGSVSSRDAFVITLRSAIAGKLGRGRMYWPSPDDSHYTTTGQFVTADMTTVKNGFASAYGTFKATTIPVVWHKLTKLGDAIVEVDININPGTQSRRTNKAAPVRVGSSV